MWTEGTIRVGASVFHYWVKHYEEPSTFGYEEGRASKISLRRNGKTVFNFDRGMDIPPEDEETETALAVVPEKFLLVYLTQENGEISTFFLSV